MHKTKLILRQFLSPTWLILNMIRTLTDSCLFVSRKKLSERHNSAAKGPASKVKKATGNEANTTGHLLKESLRNSEEGPKNILLGPW